MTEYTNTNGAYKIIKEYSKLAQIQKNNNELLMAIIDKSYKHNTDFLQNINSNSDLRKVKLLQKLVIM